MTKIYIGADHGGYETKEKVKKWLNKEKLDFVDVGTDSEESTDYPIYAEKVGKAVSEGLGRGILICKSGQGMSIAVNKIRGVRAGLAWNIEVAIKSREHNDTNVLCLPSNYITDEEVMKIIEMWLSTPFSGDERHKRRIDMIYNISQS